MLFFNSPTLLFASLLPAAISGLPQVAPPAPFKSPSAAALPAPAGPPGAFKSPSAAAVPAPAGGSSSAGVPAPADDSTHNSTSQSLIPYPRKNNARTCPSKPGNADFHVTGRTGIPRVFVTPSLEYPPDVADLSVLVDDPVLGLTLDFAFKPFPGDKPEPGALACRRIASTDFAQHTEFNIPTSPLPLGPKIRYAFGFHVNTLSRHASIVLGDGRTIWSRVYEGQATRGVVEFALKAPQNVSLVVDVVGQASSGQIALYHLGP